MNPELEALIMAYEAVSSSSDEEAEQCLEVFESGLDAVLERVPGMTRDTLRRIVIKAHRTWALGQERKPPAIPPKA